MSSTVAAANRSLPAHRREKSARTNESLVSYGETSRAASIELDTSTYDERLKMMEEHRARLMEEYNKWDYGFGPGLLSPDSIYDSVWVRRHPGAICCFVPRSVLSGPR